MNPIIYLIISIILVLILSLLVLHFGINHRDYDSDTVPLIVSALVVGFAIFQIFSLHSVTKSEVVITDVVNKYKAGKLTEISVPTENGNIIKYRY